MEKREIIRIGLRAVACKAWRWMPGMLTLGFSPNRVVAVQPDWLALDDLMGSGVGARPADTLPDLSDPATRGCLIELVRDAWGDHSMYAQDRAPDGWWVWQSQADAGTLARGWASEAEALVAALEAAPVKP